MRRSYRLAVHRLEVRIVSIYEQGRANTLDIVSRIQELRRARRPGRILAAAQGPGRAHRRPGQACAKRSAGNARPHTRDEAASRGRYAHDSGADRPGAFASRQPRLAGGLALVRAAPAAGGGFAAAREPEGDGGRVGLAPAVERGARGQDPGGAEPPARRPRRARPRRAASSGRSTGPWRVPSVTAASKVCAARTRGSTSAWATERRSMRPASGTVIEAAWEGGYGNLILIDHGGGLATAYGHQSSFAVGSGAHVSQGTGDRLRRLYGPLLRAASALRGACQRRGG